MPSIETSIWLALRSRVAALVLSPALPIAWPNDDFTPPVSGYLRVTHIPNINRRLFIGSGKPHQRLGLLRVDVFSRINQNVAVGTEIAGTVAAWFPSDLRLTSNGVSVRITQAPTVGAPIRDDPHWLTPVSIEHETLA